VRQNSVLLHELRQVHNHYAGGAQGFKYWVTDEPNPLEHRCYCGWLDGAEHYGTVGWVDETGVCWRKGRRVELPSPLVPPGWEKLPLREGSASAADADGGEVPWE
jgi:hypothetical protein